MNYTYDKKGENGDATADYELVGQFPVKFIDFMKNILKNEDSFRVQFGSMNEKFGGWLGNRLEFYKYGSEWYVTNQEPEKWFNEIRDLQVISCWCNGGWGQISYFCTFAEN